MVPGEVSEAGEIVPGPALIHSEQRRPFTWKTIFSITPSATDTDLGWLQLEEEPVFACRFNTFNNISFAGTCSGHGTDTTGRARGVRQWEGYYNTGTCSSTTSGCGSAWPGRSGVGMSFGNSFTNVGGGFMKGLADLNPQRTWRASDPLGRLQWRQSLGHE